MTPIKIKNIERDYFFARHSPEKRRYFSRVIDGNEDIIWQNAEQKFLVATGRCNQWQCRVNTAAMNLHAHLSVISQLTPEMDILGFTRVIKRFDGMLYIWTAPDEDVYAWGWYELDLGLDPGGWTLLDQMGGVGIHNGKLYTWNGRTGVRCTYNENGNHAGQCGLGHTDEVTEPTQVGTAENWVYAEKRAHLLALNSDGEIWSAGLNHRGQLGNANTTNQHSLVRAGEEDGWELVRINSGTSYAIKNGRLYTWGNNVQGSRMDDSGMEWNMNGDWFPEDNMIGEGTEFETGWTDVMGVFRSGVGIINGKICGAGETYNNAGNLEITDSVFDIEEHEQGDTYEFASKKSDGNMVFFKRHRDNKIVGGFSNQHGRLGRGNLEYPVKFSLCYKGYDTVEQVFVNANETTMAVLKDPGKYVSELIYESPPTPTPTS